MGWKILGWYLVIRVYCLESVSGRGRRCCRYSSNSSVCQGRVDGCVLVENGEPIFSSAESCLVEYDSKKDKFEPGLCEKESFESDEPLKAEAFWLESYVYRSSLSQAFPALDLKIPFDDIPWETLRFRFLYRGTDGGPSPRCVRIRRNLLYEDSLMEKPRTLSYDCESGFYVSGSHSLINTGGSTYQLDLCLLLFPDGLERCGSYLFIMPDEERLRREEPNVILVERHSLQKLYLVKLHSAIDVKKIGIFRSPGEELISSYLYLKNSSVPLIKPSPGNYRIAVEEGVFNGENPSWTTVAEFKIFPEINVYIVAVCALLFVLWIVILAYYIRCKFYRLKDKYYILPNDFVQNENIRPIDIFITTNVDNQDHNEVITCLSNYLKAHCGINKVYHAMDPETGIVTQKNHDPWIWAQNVTERMKDKEGHLLFIASPPSSLSVPLYTNLSDNQTLILTKYLESMIKKGKVSVVNFPYSDPSSVSALLPMKIPSVFRFALPWQMNEFLCHVLDIKRLRSFPLKFIKPEISSKDLKNFRGGSELISLIDNLTSKTQSESKDFTEKEKDNLLSRVKLKSTNRFVGSQNVATPSNSPSLQIEIEPNILSLRDESVVENRDTGLNAEFM